jgi:hypothetical protein
MSPSKPAPEEEPSPERKRYRGLLEITDLVVRAKNLPDAFKELAPPGAGPDGGRIAELLPP